MDLEELRGFMAVVDSGSLLGAATHLGIPRATLRRRIDALEARAGVPLLERSARGVNVTDAGMILVDRGRRLLEEGAALLAAVQQLGQEPARTFRIHVPVGLPPTGVVTQTKILQAFMPHLGLSIHVSEDPLANLHHDVDLAMHLDDRAPPPPWQDQTLLTMPVHLLGSPEYLEARGRPETVDDLAHHSLAAWAPPNGTADRWTLRTGQTVTVRPVLVSNDPHLLRQHARAGVGLAWLPDAPLDLLGLPIDELVPVLDDVLGHRMSLKMSIPEAQANRPKVQKVITLVQRFFAYGAQASLTGHRGQNPPDDQTGQDCESLS